METRILSSEDIRRIALAVGLDALMDAMIERLDAALQAFDPAQTTVYPRRGFTYTRPATGLLEWMPCLSSAHRATIKVVGYHPDNARQHRLPTILATVSEYDTTNGHLTCMMDGTFLTALRTGAASAVASRILAAPQAATVGLIGAGAQAVTQLHALTRVLDLDRVLVYDLNPAHQASFAHRAERFAGALRIEPATVDTIVRSADVICTATSVEIGGGPVLGAAAPKPWVHINAIGSDFPGKVELPVALLKRCLVCPDNREQAALEGECQQLADDEIGPDLWELVQRREHYRFAQEQMSVFDSTGWALEDQVAMHLLMEYAADLGVGMSVPVEIITEDALNPYDFLQQDEQAVAEYAAMADGQVNASTIV